MSKKTKHTLGPWVFVDQNTVLSENDGNIAEISYAGGVSENCNAQLTAAAPDMLNALEMIRAMLGQKITFVELEYMKKLATEAIKKARGES